MIDALLPRYDLVYDAKSACENGRGLKRQMSSFSSRETYRWRISLYTPKCIIRI